MASDAQEIDTHGLYVNVDLADGLGSVGVHENSALVSNRRDLHHGNRSSGGGIAGDFAICAVPAMVQDLQMEDVPFWGYFAQISDASTSYGGYSGAVPNEKITWGKLDVDTPKFMIQSDATIVAPLIFGYLLND